MSKISNSVSQHNSFFFAALDACCQKIVEKMGDKPISEWRVSEYNSLSSRLGKQTKVYLSENTLKRIFGRLKTSERYLPQKATRDALAQFIDYRDWEEFEKVFNSANIAKENVLAAEEIKKESPITIAIKKRGNFNFLKISIGIFIILLTIGFVFFLRENEVPKNVKLICENPFGKVPHTAVFKLQSDQPINSDDIFKIDFIDEAVPATIQGNQRVTKFFRNPGVVYATLSYHNKPLDTVSVYLQTHGWVANSGNDTSRAYPIANLKSLDPKNIYVSSNQLDSAGLDTKKPFLVGFSNIKPSHISGDNFSFKCRVFPEQSRPGTQCGQTTVIILGEKHRHLLTLYRKSCVAFDEYKFSEVHVYGSEKFLGNLAFDSENGGDIEIKVENKVAHVILNGRNVLTTTYKRSIGNIMGVKILFNGIGRAVSPKIEDLKTHEVY